MPLTPFDIPDDGQPIDWTVFDKPLPAKSGLRKLRRKKRPKK